jgi:hypothetical protein
MTPEQLRRLENLERQMRDHYHNGFDNSLINLRDILGTIEVVSAAPDTTPTTISGQFKIYTNGATLRFYWYDTVAALWHYVTATA